MGGGEGPAVVSRWWVRWLPEVGVGGFGFREERDGGEVSGTVRLAGKNGAERGKCDLKQVLEQLSLSAFERT
jgi:hypothetical protein